MRVLTQAEFDSVYADIIDDFADKCLAEVKIAMYRTKRMPSLDAEILWLYVYALNTWDNTDGAYNYLTETQMLKILEKAQRHGF